ncbi:MAG TPA: hypothetical protein VMK12_28745 [Anaeromyxobacteraceae bacterium]|nr:hypothetical protein [Anaeromyxobacteraceae bacterium]
MRTWSIKPSTGFSALISPSPICPKSTPRCCERQMVDGGWHVAMSGSLKSFWIDT